MGKQWWRPVAALFVVGATLFLTMLLGFGAAVAFNGAIGFVAGEPNPGAGIALTVLAVLVLVGGMWLAWRVAAGCWGPRPTSAAAHTRHVSEPGTSLTDSPGGTKVAWLPGGTPVVEIEQQGDFIKVTTREARTGWVKQRSVF